MQVCCNLSIRHQICLCPLTAQINFSTMGQNNGTKMPHRQNSLNMRSIFRCMMEGGYYPEFVNTHILFNIDDDVAVVEYEEDILSIRIFFSIDEEAYGLFLEATNSAMLKSFIVKPIVMDNMQKLMFSCEMVCGNVREFRHCFPRGIHYLKEAIAMHKFEMKRLLMVKNAPGMVS